MEAANLLVYFTSEISGIDTRTELLLSFETTDTEGTFPHVATTPSEWGLVGNPNKTTHSTATVMWSFADIPEGDYIVWWARPR